jgi:type VI secretion system protein VasG
VLSKHFKPALLARMSIVPFSPIDRTIMKQIATMKLGALAGRLRTAHGIETTFEPALVDEITKRCTEAETGARTVDHILRGSLMPLIARPLLERLAEGSAPTTLTVGLAPDGSFRVEIED